VNRRSRLCALLLILLPVPGCAAIPTHTNAKAIGPSASRQSQAAVQPTKDLDPYSLVRAFITASANPDGNYAEAKGYLTDDAKKNWDTKSTPTIIDNVFNTVPSAGDADLPIDAKARTVLLQGRNVGRLLADDYSFVQVVGELNKGVGLEQVEGQWRISDPPEGVYMTSAGFSKNFQRVTLFFYNKDFTVLVPDPRFVVVPPSTGIPQRVTELLVKGPSNGMRGALFSALGADAGYNKNTQESDEGALEVDLTRLGDLTPQSRKRIVAQVVKSLAGVTSSRIRVLLDGAVISTDQKDWRAADVQSGEALITPNADQRGMVVSGGRVLSLEDGGPVDGPAGTGEYDVASAAQSLDGSELAVVSRTGSNSVRLRVGPANQALRDVELPATTLTRPTWLLSSRAGAPSDEVWTVADGTNLVRVVKTDGGGWSANAVNAIELAGFGPITEMRLSRDGTRVAVVAGGKLVVAAVVRSEDSSVSIRAPRHLQPGVLGANVLSLDWLSQDVLVASTSLAAQPIVKVDVDGLKMDRYSTSNLTAPVNSVAAAPGRPVMAADRTGLWIATDVGDVWRASQVKPEPGAFVFYPG
jgi:hypothetical protein